MQNKIKFLSALTLLIFLSASCATSYKAQPLPFRAPSSYPNAVQVGGAVMAAEAFAVPKKAEEAFGFDVRGAGFLPVQVICRIHFLHEYPRMNA